MNDKKQQIAFDKLAAHYNQHACLPQHMGEQILQRLACFDLDVSLLVDLGAGTGLFNASLARAFPGATVIAVDLSSTMLAHNNAASKVQASAAALTLAKDSVDFVFANALLPFCEDMHAVFAECRRVLKPNGLIFFSSFGPNNGLPDMHDVGDALVAAGFVDPVMEVEHLSLAYSNMAAMQAELSAVGLLEFVDAATSSPAFEVVYGHAWCGDRQTSTMNDAGEAFVAVDQIMRR